MAANFKVFVDGNRLPAEEVNNFLAKQCVVQVDGQNDLAPLTEFGVRIAMTLDTGALWFYTDLGGWSPLEIDGLLTLDEADARYLTQITAEGLFLTKSEGADFITGDEVATTYLAKLTAEGLYLSQTDATQNYLGKTEAAQTYLTQLSAQGLYITSANANATFLSQSEANQLYLTPQDANSTYLTLIGAGQIYLRQDTASNTYITSASAGTLFVSKGGAAGDVNANNTTIDGGKITTNSINVNRLVAGTLTGFRIQTSSSGQRVVVSEQTNSLVFFNSSNTEIGRITGLASFNYDTPGNHAFQVNGSTVFSVNSSGISLAPGENFNSNVPVVGNVTATGSVTSQSFIRSNSDGTPATMHSNGGISAGSGLSPAAGEILATSNIEAGASLRSGTTTIVGVMATTSLAANVRHQSNGSALIRFTSDARIKDDIQPLSDGLNIINQLNPVTFDSLVDDDERRIPGFIAQDVEEVFPEDIYMVTQVPGLAPEGLDIQDIEENPLRSLEPTHFIPYLVKAVQELSAKNDALEARLAALEGGAE